LHALVPGKMHAWKVFDGEEGDNTMYSLPFGGFSYVVYLIAGGVMTVSGLIGRWWNRHRAP
jgi:hypothetical protein